MNFSWSEDQLELKRDIIEFAQSNLGKEVITRDQGCTFDHKGWQACAGKGLLGLAIPPEYGGQGLDLATTVLALEGLGYGCLDNGLSFAIASELVSVQAALMIGASESQKKQYLKGVCEGKLIGAYAMTEEHSGSDAFSLSTTAQKVDGGYILNGEKILVTLGPVSDFVLIFATTDPALGSWGVSLFIVDKHLEGFSSSPTQAKMGLRTTPIGKIRLEQCLVPAENLVGEEGSGAALFNVSQNWERAMILAAQLGIMEKQLEDCIEYANNRRQFNQPIGKFQAVSHRIVDMKIRLDVARQLAYRAAWMLDQGQTATLECSMANIYLSESFIQSGLDAIMIHGGRGYLTENHVERDLRDAIGAPLYGGTTDIQKNIIAKSLGL